MEFLKKVKEAKIGYHISEGIIRVCSFPIWFPILCYKYGLVYSDILKDKFIDKND
tara:strand:+ start:2247 stop:2411 length:165 start_codon:yes stop_codon:yes gene_type:complete